MSNYGEVIPDGEDEADRERRRRIAIAKKGSAIIDKALSKEDRIRMKPLMALSAKELREIFFEERLHEDSHRS